MAGFYKRLVTTRFTRPDDLAYFLGHKDGKQVRIYLRSQYGTSVEHNGTTIWKLTPDMVDNVVKHFVAVGKNADN